MASSLHLGIYGWESDFNQQTSREIIAKENKKCRNSGSLESCNIVHD